MLRLGGFFQRLNARRKTRQFSGCCIFIQQAFGNTSLNFRLCCAQSELSGLGIASTDRLFNFFDERADTARAGFVGLRFSGIATHAFSCRSVICHFSFTFRCV
jgi:hypothetical protein